MNQEVLGSVRTDRPPDCVTHRTLLGNQPYISPHIRAPRSPHHHADERRARRALQWRRKKSPMTPSAVRNHHRRASVSWFAFRPGVFRFFVSPSCGDQKPKPNLGGWGGWGWFSPITCKMQLGWFFLYQKVGARGEEKQPLVSFTQVIPEASGPWISPVSDTGQWSLLSR